MDDRAFQKLIDYLSKVSAIEQLIGKGADEDGIWWVKFFINKDHELAWQVVQETEHLVNYFSIDEKLSAQFYPVSPPPYMNGGPKEYLS